MQTKLLTALLGTLLCLSAGVNAQQKNATALSATESFAPVDHLPASAMRTADGRPGPAYWQNRADYHVNVSFDTLTRLLKGKVSITYINNSPSALSCIWLDVSQNRFKKDSRTSILTPPDGSRFGVQEFTEGCRIHTLRVSAGSRPPAIANYTETDTYIQVQLSSPLARGQKATIEVEYDFVLPFNGSDYMGILRTSHGSVFQFAGMFPRVCVYDDIQGWNVFTSGYYVEPGSLDISISVPGGMIVQGTGQLMNPEEVLETSNLHRYQKAWRSDSVIQVRSIADIHSRYIPSKQKTWRFHADNAGDGLWAISSSFLWDAVRVDLPGGSTTLAMALYPPESNAEWRKITLQMKQILQLYSTKWAPYPYRTCVNIAGGITGVAAPAVCVLHYRNTMYGNNIWTKTNHEIGHTWFNMMVSVDSRNGWMCEGLNTFINFINCDSLKQESAFQMNDAIEWLSTERKTPALNTPAASVAMADMAMTMYVKPSVAISLLRDQVIGRDRFDKAFRTFIKDWTFKHPVPSDFFRSMENGTGEDLSWFWRGWFLNDWKSDPAIQKAVYVNNDPAQGIDVTVENKQKMVMPLTVEVREFNGNNQRLHFPAQVWQQGFLHTFHVSSTSPVIAVTIDPDKSMPDLDRSNNSWKGTAVKTPVPVGATAKTVIARYLAAIGGEEKLHKITKADIRYISRVNGSLLFEKKFSPGQENSIAISLENIHLLLKKVVANVSTVTYNDLDSAVSLSAAQQEDLRGCTSLIPELNFFDERHTAILDDSLININGMDTYLVHVSTGGEEGWDYYYDSNTGLKVLEMTSSRKQERLPYSQLEFSGYQKQQGIFWPSIMTVSTGTSSEDMALKMFSLEYIPAL